MPESNNEIIVRYLEDAVAAERNFEDQLFSLSKTGEQSYVQQFFADAAEGAGRQHRLLEQRLRALGGRPSLAKSALAHILAFGPATAQIGQDAQEKNTQHLIMASAAASAEMAMYEALATVSSAAGDVETESLARQMQDQERTDREQAWSLLGRSASEAFVSNSSTAKEALIRYFENSIAAEKTFEDQLRSFANTGDAETAKALFQQHADETRLQYERLTRRLQELGGSPSTLKSVMAHVFAFAPAAAQVGHDALEKNTQHLIIAYSVENAELAMYESFAIAAHAAGDAETEQLVREIQQQEKSTAEKVWTVLPMVARHAYQQVSGQAVRGGGGAA